MHYIKLKNLKILMLSILTCCLLSCCLLTGCYSGSDLDNIIDSATQPYKFSLIGWEFQAIKLYLLSTEASTGSPQDVIDYFSYTDRLRSLNSQIALIEDGNSQGNLMDIREEIDNLQFESLL